MNFESTEIHRPSTAEPLVLRETADGVTTLTLNRPETRNGLSIALLEELQSELDAVRKDKDTSVVIMAARGPVFCAGHDLKELRANPTDRYREELFMRCSAMMESIVRLPKPVIAQVYGVATAAGCQLVASCDLAIAADDAHFATPGVNIGLFCSTPMVALSRNVSRKHAMEMLLTGDMIDAAKAVEIGLINRAVSADDLATAVLEMAHKITSKSPLTLAIGKEAFYRQLDMDLGAAYAYTSDVMVKNMRAHDAKEGIDAFMEKRPAKWTGR